MLESLKNSKQLLKKKSIAIAKLKKEYNTEVQKRKEVNAGIEKAQTELKRLREEIEAFEEIERGKSHHQ